MAAITNNKLFPIQLWLWTTVIVGPILLGMGSALYDSRFFHNSANIGVIFLFIPFGLLFSLPTFFVVWLTYSFIEQKVSLVLLKVISTVVAMTGVFITFSVIGGSMAKTYSLIYSASIVLSALILRVKKS